ncbi:hypothetical protein VA249_30070 [Vibrio alfacsensis]|uniref:LamG domain-containing protein n=1 Tax=Vibrio alfacsensis TaxID=1074311 RepID=UPI001BF13C45|nr:LamG domain-containing protein [Vibrio alfacsensis]BBM66361.1 hypothetical protein VA249_30070 [Vibrio alfacsensis]
MTAFTMLPITVNNDKLPVLDPDSYEPFGIIETNAVRHWILGRDTGLVDLKSQKSLVPYVNSPLLQSNHAVVGGDYSTSTEIKDDVNQTLIAVFSVTDKNSLTPLSSYETPNSVGKGILVGNSGELVTFVNKGNGANVVQGYSFSGEWVFAAISISPTHTIMSIPALSVDDTVVASSNGSSGYTINIGGRSGGGFDNLAPVAEAIIFDKALSSSEILKVYQRSKSRMADRGIVI